MGTDPFSSEELLLLASLAWVLPSGVLGIQEPGCSSFEIAVVGVAAAPVPWGAKIFSAGVCNLISDHVRYHILIAIFLQFFRDPVGSQQIRCRSLTHSGSKSSSSRA